MPFDAYLKLSVTDVHDYFSMIKTKMRSVCKLAVNSQLIRQSTKIILLNIILDIS